MRKPVPSYVALLVRILYVTVVTLEQKRHSGGVPVQDCIGTFLYKILSVCSNLGHPASLCR